MSLKRVQTASFAVLIIAFILSLYVSGPAIQNTTMVRTFPQSKLGEKDTLFKIEPINPTPNRLNFSYTSNATISLFVQTNSQYESSSKNAIPEDYLATFTGDEGYIAYEPTDKTKRHVISVFAEERFRVNDILLESEYGSVSESSPSTTFILLQLLIFAALLAQGYTIYLQSKVD